MREIPLAKVSPEEYDVIVAGAGAGGLLTGLALTGSGKRVLVIERSDRLGGVWHGYWVDGYRVDQGLHVITRVTRGAFTQFLREFLPEPPKYVLHEGWYFRVGDRVATIPTSIGQTLRWPLTDLRGRLALARVGAKIKTMKLEEMKRYKDITFAEFLDHHNMTNQTIRDVIESAIYLAAGVGIDKASAYEALRTLKDTDREQSKLALLRRLLFGSLEYDEGYVIGGMIGLVEKVAEAINGDYVLNAPVEAIVERDGRVTGIEVAGDEIRHERVVSNIPLWSMPSIVQSQRNDVVNFFERWSHMHMTRGVTLWLGLDEVVVGDRKSRVIVHPRPSRWLVSISSFDPSCVPDGKELVAIATIAHPDLSLDEHVEMIKGGGLEKYYPRILEHVEMEHAQMSYATRAALIPGQTDLDRPGPRTPIRGLYIVGTDTAGAGVGLQQAANSARGVVRAVLDDMSGL